MKETLERNDLIKAIELVGRCKQTYTNLMDIRTAKYDEYEELVVAMDIALVFLRKQLRTLQEVTDGE